MRRGLYLSAKRWPILAGIALMCAVLPAPTFSADKPDENQLRLMREQARILEHGEGVPKDPAQALKIYCEASRSGDAEAAYAAGWMIANGRGVARDDPVAAYFFEIAAQGGHEQAKSMLRFVGQPTKEMPECLIEPVVKQREDDMTGFTFDNPKQRELAELVIRLAPEYGIAPRLALAVAKTESNLNPTAVSVKDAQGLMQLIPETSVRFNVRKPFDPEQNVRGGLAYLRWLLAYFKGDVALCVAAYNAGEGAVNRYKGIPPYPETRGYVHRILQVYPNPEHPFDASVVEPSPELPRILKKKGRKQS